MAFKEAADKNQISTLQAVAKCWKKSGYTIKDSSYLEEYTGMALQEAKSKYLAIKNIRTSIYRILRVHFFCLCKNKQHNP